jgi:hypothetical protein
MLFLYFVGDVRQVKGKSLTQRREDAEGRKGKPNPEIGNAADRGIAGSLPWPSLRFFAPLRLCVGLAL